MKKYWQMFSVFFRIGAFTLGGGYSMIPLIQKEVVEKKRWLSEKDFIDTLAVAQSAPGVMAVNTAIFVGYKLKGLKGSIVTTLGCALPSFIIILLVAMVFTDIKDNEIVNRVFKGIRPVVVALIVTPLWNMSKAAGINWKTVIIPVGVALIIWLTGASPVIFIVLAITGGILFGLIRTRKKKNI
ncbi:MAG: chromate transporter [Bacteroidales bacterium]|jgi:chromate transporter|nr:chromate transporter [Bacteroidales bacterium]